MSNAAEKQPEPGHSASLVMTWYQVTLSAIGDAVLTTDPEGRVTFMNPMAESLTGWVVAESHGKPLGEVFRIINELTEERSIQTEGKNIALLNLDKLKELTRENIQKTDFVDS